MSTTVIFSVFHLPFRKQVFTVKSQQTQNICITFLQCRTSVEDVGPTLYKWYTNVLCLLGCVLNRSRTLINVMTLILQNQVIFNHWKLWIAVVDDTLRDCCLHIS